MHPLPQGAPETINEAFAYIGSLKSPSVEDLKVMVLIEAASKTLYEALAASVTNEKVQTLLVSNGREELAHAHRVSRVIGKLTGTDYPVPAPEENPYLVAPIPKSDVTAASLAALAASEFGGETLYESWAASCANAEAAALLRLNGREETQHGGRLQEAAALLAAA